MRLVAWEESGGGGGGGGESFPHFWINSVKENSKGGKEKERGGEGKHRRNGKKREERKKKIFPTFRRSKLDGPRIKVGPRNESYAWVPK